MQIKKGDNIIVITGKDKGKKGKVVHVLPRENRVIVDGVNMRKKHERAGVKGRKSGQIVEIAMPIHASNVMIEDPKTGKPTRIGKNVSGGKSIRVTKKSGTEI